MRWGAEQGERRLCPSPHSLPTCPKNQPGPSPSDCHSSSVRTWVSGGACRPQPGYLFKVTLHFSAHIHFESLSEFNILRIIFPIIGGFLSSTCSHHTLSMFTPKNTNTGVLQFIRYTRRFTSIFKDDC